MSVVDSVVPNIHITKNAQNHFNYLIEKEEIPGMGLRIFIEYPGSPRADVNISFCPPGEYRAGDLPIQFDAFTLYIERNSISYLEGAEIDFKEEGLQGQLAITAPRLHGNKPKEEADITEKVNYLLQSEINPGLASHGGMVSLVEITPNNEVILRFGGGCHGCGMVDVTLKQGIEKTLRAHIPEITAVKDVTDHSQGENPYY